MAVFDNLYSRFGVYDLLPYLVQSIQAPLGFDPAQPQPQTTPQEAQQQPPAQQPSNGQPQLDTSQYSGLLGLGTARELPRALSILDLARSFQGIGNTTRLAPKQQNYGPYRGLGR